MKWAKLDSMSGPGDGDDDGKAPAVAPAEPSPAPAKSGEDVVFVHGPTEHGLQITRLREQRVESGELRTVKEGQPIVGELVKLSQREESERLFNVEVLAKGPAAPP